MKYLKYIFVVIVLGIAIGITGNYTLLAAFSLASLFLCLGLFGILGRKEIPKDEDDHYQDDDMEKSKDKIKLFVGRVAFVFIGFSACYGLIEVSIGAKDFNPPKKEYKQKLDVKKMLGNYK